MRHRFHALCPYFAMFPEAFVHDWLQVISRPGDLVLDPFCGRGTTPFQSLLMDRRAVACDVNDVAFCVTRAKTNAPSIRALNARLQELEQDYQRQDWDELAEQMPEFFHVAYAQATLRQILYLRDNLDWRNRNVDTMIAALTLGSLHGESQRSRLYLSNQMPRTISTKPAYSVRYWQTHNLTAPEQDTFELLRNRARYRYESRRPQSRARVFHCDMRNLPHRLGRQRANCVITSPPYLDVTNFEEDQWLRLWFLGRQAYPTYRGVSQDDRHTNEQQYWAFIRDAWNTMAQALDENAHIVIRIGATELAAEYIEQNLTDAADQCGRQIELLTRAQSALVKRQTRSFRPGTQGCRMEFDFHYLMT